jgi:D-3-phosphoglycerate dehydrogenase
MAKFKVVVTDLGYKTYKYEAAELKRINARLVLTKCKTEDDVIKNAKDADAVLVRWAPITARVINGLAKCKIISRYGTGYDNVDAAAAAARGIIVTNVPDYCMEEVSDQALALLMSCARKITEHDKTIRKGAWDIAAKNPIFRMAGKTMGIVGLGRIGSTFLRKIKGFNFGQILVCDPYIARKAAEKKYGVKLVDLKTLLKKSDYISLHVPLYKATRHLIGAPELKMMKKTAILVNTSRGPVVDNAALYQALKSRRINSAGIDVWEKEPVPVTSPLFKLPNLVVSDHAAWYSEESEIELKTSVAHNAVEALTGQKVKNVVNQEPWRKLAGI